MTLFLIERNFAERIEITPEIAGSVGAVNADCGANRSHSYQTADRKKTYCLYDSPNAESVQNAATAAGVPADVIV